uniref:CSON008262 protein n=1 Tax=Culicoides sonorensis TaxID=179676 RepID=A0A336KFP3_CULSO
MPFNKINNNNNLKISKAALWDNYELLEDLLSEEAHLINCVDSWGRTPLHASAITADSQCMRILINAGADVNIQCGPRGDNKTALHLSAEHGHASNMKELLNAGASFTVKDINGLTPLDLADRGKHEECITILREAAGK